MSQACFRVFQPQQSKTAVC